MSFNSFKLKNGVDQTSFVSELKKILFLCSTIPNIVDLFACCLSFKAFKLKNGIDQTSFVSELKNNICVF